MSPISHRGLTLTILVFRRVAMSLEVVAVRERLNFRSLTTPIGMR